MSEELIPEQLSLDEQIDKKLVKGNVTEAVIADLRERYLPLKIAGIEDKETYLLVKEGRKNCKAIRVMAKKICTDGREDAVAIQKKWVAKEKEVTSRIAEVEDYLEAQEKAYEADVAAEKEARKRKQEEQFIMRQQALSGMGALYSDGNFVLGDVSFEFSAIKESEEDIWAEMIFPKYQEEYNKIEADRIEEDRLKAEKEAELKRQQEELEKKQKELADKEAKLKEEADRQELEAAHKRSQRFEFRSQQLKSIGFEVYGVDWHAFREFKIAMATVWNCDDNAWELQLISAKQYVEQVLEEEAEERRKEQERQELQKKRYAELLPYKEFIEPVEMDKLWLLQEEQYMGLLDGGRTSFNSHEEEKAKKIAEDAAKAERERIEEEQRQLAMKQKMELHTARVQALAESGIPYNDSMGDLSGLPVDDWFSFFNGLVQLQEEERIANAGDKEKWNEIMERIEAIEVYAMRSSQYRKKAAILREKLEEIKSL